MREVDQELDYVGTPDLFDGVLGRASDLGVDLRIVERRTSRGAGDIALVLLAAGASEAVKQLISEFATSLRERSRHRTPPTQSDDEEPS